MRPPSLRRRVGLGIVGSIALTILSLAVSACGGGGGGGERSTPLAIATTTLPAAGQNVPYSLTFQASGGSGPYQWALDAGSALPLGLSLASTGTLSGTATTLGTYSFSVVVTDASAATDHGSYLLEVTPFSASISILHWGDAWYGETYSLSAVGGGASTTFTFVTNASGGTITGSQPSAGTATYVPGPSSGTDVIRAASAGGPTQDLPVAVYHNPVAHMTARFSNTDVWHCRFDGKRDATHAFANDFDSALASAGLRDPTSIGAEGTTADQLARAYVRQQVLRYLNAMYLNAEDGHPLAGGLAISFPYDEPDAPHYHPKDGEVATAHSNQFNVMSFLAGTDPNVVGTANTDSPTNELQENDTSTAAAGDLGVFVDEIVYYFNAGYGNTQLTADPVKPSDVAALKALFYGAASPGGRYDELRRIGEGLGRTIASVAAHEIGHSLGLQHTNPPQTSSIMNPAASFGPNETYAFIASDVTSLQGALPGPNRGGAAQTAGEAAPGTGSFGFEKVECGVTHPR